MYCWLSFVFFSKENSGTCFSAQNCIMLVVKISILFSWCYEASGDLSKKLKRSPLFCPIAEKLIVSPLKLDKWRGCTFLCSARIPGIPSSSESHERMKPCPHIDCFTIMCCHLEGVLPFTQGCGISHIYEQLTKSQDTVDQKLEKLLNRLAERC